MILYHGTYTDFQEIELDKCLPYKDFGKGFYLTDILEQADAMAQKKSRIYGGSPIVQKYEFKEDVLTSGDLNVLVFEKPTKEWAEFIYKNRSRRAHFSHEYDIVIGPIANDGVAYLLDRYEEGTLTLDELAEELEYKRLNSQYYFGNTKALEFISRI